MAAFSQEQHRGTYWYWFGTPALTDSWFQDQIKVSIANAGPRYSPELQIDTEQQLQFDAMGRTPTFHAEIIEIFTSLRIAARSLFATSEHEDIRTEAGIAKNALKTLLDAIDPWATAEISTATWWHVNKMPWHEVDKYLDLLSDNIYACWRKIESLRRGTPIREGPRVRKKYV